MPLLPHQHRLEFALLFLLIADILLPSIYFSLGKSHIHRKKMCSKQKTLLEAGRKINNWFVSSYHYQPEPLRRHWGTFHSQRLYYVFSNLWAQIVGQKGSSVVETKKSKKKKSTKTNNKTNKPTPKTDQQTPLNISTLHQDTKERLRSEPNRLFECKNGSYRDALHLIIKTFISDFLNFFMYFVLMCF